MLDALHDFAATTRAALKASADIEAALGAVAKNLAALCRDQDFVTQAFDEEAPFGHRELYRDPELDFRVLAHVQAPGKKGKPHDHGASWAVYGTARGFTRMRDWRRVSSEPDKTVLELVRTYDLKEGEAHFFGPHAVHSTEHPAKAWVVRVTGTDLDAIPRYHFRSRCDEMLEPA